MPLINVKPIEGVLDAAQKRDIVQTLTEAMVSIGGNTLTTADLKNLAAANLQRCSAKSVDHYGPAQEGDLNSEPTTTIERQGDR